MTRSVDKSEWHPASWQSLTAAQQPSYPDKAAFERAIAANPTLARAHAGLSRVHLARGQSANALVAARQACAANPREHDANVALIWSLQANRRNDEAVVAAERLVAIAPEVAESHNALGAPTASASVPAGANRGCRSGTLFPARLLHGVVRRWQ